MSNKNQLMMGFLIPVFLYFVLLPANLHSTSDEAKKTTNDFITPPPKSLDAYYPPKTKQPVFLLMMYEMSASMSGIVTDLMENDLINVNNNFEKFKSLFEKVSNLVPEWKHYFQMDIVDALGINLKQGDRNTIMPAIEAVGKICADCHNVNMPKVQFKYHWSDFSEIKVTDPFIQQKMPFQQFKHLLEANFNGIMMSLHQEQTQNAQQYFQAFKSRFQTLKETCQECHGDSERKYYVDAEIMQTIDMLGNALNSQIPHREKIGGLIMEIGNNSCGKCHLVHTPAALTKMLWK